jgi:hypothetical protein
MDPLTPSLTPRNPKDHDKVPEPESLSGAATRQIPQVIPVTSMLTKQNSTPSLHKTPEQTPEEIELRDETTAALTAGSQTVAPQAENDTSATRGQSKEAGFSSERNASSASTHGFGGNWLLPEMGEEYPMSLGTVSQATTKLRRKPVSDPKHFGISPLSAEIVKDIPQLSQYPILLQFPVQSVNPDSLMALSRSQRRTLMNHLSNLRQLSQVMLSDGTIISKTRWFGTNGSQLSNSALLAISVALRRRPVVFAELLGLSPPSVLLELKPFCRSPLVGWEHIPRFIHAVGRSVFHRHSNPIEPATIATIAGDIVATMIENCGPSKISDSKQDFIPEFLNVIRAQQSEDAGMHIGLMRSGIEKYIKNSRDKLEKKLEIGQVIVDSTFGALSAVPIVSALPAALAPTAHAFGDRYKKRKLEKWDSLRQHMDLAIQDSIIGQMNVYKTFIPVRNAEGEVKEKIAVDAAKFLNGYKAALEYNSIPYYPSIDK